MKVNICTLLNIFNYSKLLDAFQILNLYQQNLKSKANSSKLSTYNFLLSTFYLQLFTYYLLLTTFCFLLSNYFQLSTYYFLLITKNRILIGDYVSIDAVSEGLHTYSSALTGDITIPMLFVSMIEIQ